MSYRMLGRPKLRDPVLVASWPGIGNIGLIAVDYARKQLDAKACAEIEPWDFFYPRGISVKAGILEKLNFPSSIFYYKRFKERDIVFFVGEEQPNEGIRRYAGGRKAYDMAHIVMEIAKKLGCRRVFTSGAAVSLVHHTTQPRVWAVTNQEGLLKEVRHLPNTILMSDVHGRKRQGAISGLNGLLLGVAKEQEMEAFCLMGEIPVYLQGLMLPYPQASKSVLEVLSLMTGLEVDYGPLDQWALKIHERVEELMEEFSKSLPTQIRKGVTEGLEQLKTPKPSDGQFTGDDARKAIEEIERFFKQGGTGDEEGAL
ncbi:MAG: PAC2 family protein [Candidatus Eremiobacteraeota bacterium]|nr:PAC2 family protein [Candidatus Eremiobacteraeota bacterium]